MRNPIGKVVGFEINSQEPEKAATFYRNVFGWEVKEPNWDYWAINTDSNEIEGGIAKGPADFPQGTRIQIEVESIDDTITEAVNHGAKVVRVKMEFDSFFLAYLMDPTGVGIGLIERK